MAAKFAAGTEVPIHKSRADIEALLHRYGADRFISGTETGRAFIGFQVQEKYVRFLLPLPLVTDEEFQSKSRRGRPPSEDPAIKRWDQECKRRWRALHLCVKAKLEAVDSGISTFEEEFLAHIVMPNGKTLGEIAVPQLEEMGKNGKMPKLMLGME